MRYLRNAFLENLEALSAGSPGVFSTEWPSKPGWTDEDLVIHEVFYDFDEPIFFSVKTGPMLLILQKTASRFGNLYFGSMVAPEVVEAMIENQISVLAAISTGPVFVLDMVGMKVERHWRVPAESIPGAWWPTSGTCLSDQQKSATDTPAFSIGKNGPRLVQKSGSSGEGGIELRGGGFTISIASGADAARSMWGFFSGLIPVPRHVRHLKRGSDYDVLLEEVNVQCAKPINEGDLLAVYVEDDGKAWARPKTEFNDGRFETL
jgi:hypothetical protein